MKASWFLTTFLFTAAAWAQVPVMEAIPQPSAVPVAPGAAGALASLALPENSDEILKLRDPFKPPTVVEEKLAVSELETIPIEQFKMVGMISGPDRVKAIVAGPDGKTFFVSEKMRIGVRKGVIVRIQSRGIRVREMIVNVLGQEEPVESEIRVASGESEPAKRQ